jgi:universal stress protein A
MYSHILVAVEHSAADTTILAHTQALAKLVGSRMTLVHVADGWAARYYDALALRESEEMKDDRAYLDRLVGEIQSNGIAVDCTLAKGDPATEIVRVANETGVDLIAMATHGHRFLADILKGATADRVRHLAHVPVLMVRHQAQRA